MARCPRRVATPIHFRFSSLFFPQWSILPPGSPRGCHLRKLNLRLSQPSLTSSYSSTALSRNEDTRTRHYEYNWIDGTESLENYKPGGYHPITIGDMLQGRYHIVDKLGFGGYSTVWLAHDTRLEQYVAVKVCIADSTFREANILRALSPPSPYPGSNFIPALLDGFELNGPNGNHSCYTMTPARCNLKEVSFSHLFPVEVARALILLSDFGETFNPDLEPRLGKDCHTPLAARPPDAWFEIQTSLSYSADIWSLATAIWEIYRWGKRDLYFDDDGVPKDGRYVWSSIDGAFEEGVQKYRRKFGMGEFDGEETAAFLDLMRRMLTFRPEERPTAREVLQSRWMVEWVLPDFERSSQMG
ncbi:kinase-like domain-containing protein [Aspergillus flavus]|uniref:non-specific serine/threonine protein kinase n=1 Tax=Aspergillus flavus TaxID=5059 RepID=A0A5N6H2N9_ASPFL|nr:kinase-like domain-containing protein [Aspergillus flavus]